MRKQNSTCHTTKMYLLIIIMIYIHVQYACMLSKSNLKKTLPCMICFVLLQSTQYILTFDNIFAVGILCFCKLDSSILNLCHNVFYVNWPEVYIIYIWIFKHTRYTTVADK